MLAWLSPDPCRSSSAAQVAFHKVSRSLLGEFTSAKIHLNCPLQEHFSPKAWGAAVMPSRRWGCGQPPGLLQGCAAHWHHWGLCWGMRQMGIFPFWDHFWGIATLPQEEEMQQVQWFLHSYPYCGTWGWLWTHLGRFCFHCSYNYNSHLSLWTIRPRVLFYLNNLYQAMYLVLAQPVPGKMTFIEFMIM